MLRNRTALLAKIETTYGVDPTPAPETNGILCSVPEFSVVGRRLDRNNAQAFMGKQPPLNIGEGLKIKFETEIKGKSGLPDVPPEFGPLFRACNFTETITAATKVEYTPNSAVGAAESAESVAIYYYQDAILHKMLGCRGTLSFSLKAAEYGKLTWEFTGIYGGPVAGVIPAPTFNTTLPPRFLSASFSIDGYAAVIDSFTSDIGNQVVKRTSANATTGIVEWMVVDREPKGNIDPEVPALATKDFWTLWANSSQVALSATVGSVAGNKCIITAPKVVADIPTYGEREKILTHGLPFSYHSTATGNDEIKFTFQ